MSGLTKPKVVNISDSNIAGLGTELEKQIKLNAARTEEAWKGIGKEVGTLVWRIEKFHIVAWKKELYGTFYDGDSYIVLNTFKKAGDDKLYHDVHFWLGLETTQDEAGTAAYKTVELDDYLLGLPTQHREVQGYESKLFLSYFPQFIVSDGNVESGFKHVGPKEYKHRLYHVFGNKASHLSVRQVEKSYKSLNEGDVFVLDLGLQIYQFNGSKSSGQEKSKASTFAHSLASDRGAAKCQVFDQGDADATPFWEGLGGRGTIAPVVETVPPKAHEKKLFRISDSTGPLQVTLVAEGKGINKSLLSSDDVFLLDVGTQVFVYVGTKASSQEKKSGLQIANDYLIKHEMPPTTSISRVLEGGFNGEFFSFLQ